jgi:hypothetical protein
MSGGGRSVVRFKLENGRGAGTRVGMNSLEKEQHQENFRSSRYLFLSRPAH